MTYGILDLNVTYSPTMAGAVPQAAEHIRRGSENQSSDNKELPDAERPPLPDDGSVLASAYDAVAR
jgi:hypothetical protein